VHAGMAQTQLVQQVIGQAVPLLAAGTDCAACQMLQSTEFGCGNYRCECKPMCWQVSW